MMVAGTRGGSGDLMNQWFRVLSTEKMQCLCTREELAEALKVK